MSKATEALIVEQKEEDGLKSLCDLNGCSDCHDRQYPECDIRPMKQPSVCPKRPEVGQVWNAYPSQALIADRHETVNGEEGNSKPIEIVFDGPPSHESGRFVEVEQGGKSIKFGEWRDGKDGFWYLVLPKLYSGTDALIAENERLRKMFLKYGEHSNNHLGLCEQLKHSDNDCTCGFNQVLAPKEATS
ncbi:hypothetical protein LCGC14_1751510 [marine sediment metagenome]|uniref:Uncharacterized protein n=1 Tax=marine sediment metagenome TaxID=412755 RepID=A0A0F9K351_9ZZZZ